MTTRVVAEHEARHAAAAVILGIPLSKVTAIADPEKGLAGSVTPVFPKEWGRDFAYRLGLVVLVGPLGEDEGWPPPWPLLDEHPLLEEHRQDERSLKAIVRYLRLDEAGYLHMCTDAFRLAAMPEFRRFANAYGLLLERGHDLGEHDLQHVKAVVEDVMERKTMQAATIAEDLGHFTAVAASWSVDRGRDQIVRGAFAKTIEHWQASGRDLPLHWDHKSSADHVIGSVDAMSMKETGEGLEIAGQLDLDDSEVAREAWRSMKRNRVALSFGYLTTKQRKEGNINKLLELDLYEISVVPAPMNPDTRFISLKSASVPVRVATFEC